MATWPKDYYYIVQVQMPNSSKFNTYARVSSEGRGQEEYRRIVLANTDSTVRLARCIDSDTGECIVNAILEYREPST